jgi:hypothetical protein
MKSASRRISCAVLVGALGFGGFSLISAEDANAASVRQVQATLHRQQQLPRWGTFRQPQQVGPNINYRGSLQPAGGYGLKLQTPRAVWELRNHQNQQLIERERIRGEWARRAQCQNMAPYPYYPGCL